MSIAKVIEVIAESDKSFDDAVEDGKVKTFRVAMKVTFVVDK